eukprot:3975608-Pyramimonas_sp.AAC.1
MLITDAGNPCSARSTWQPARVPQRRNSASDCSAKPHEPSISAQYALASGLKLRPSPLATAELAP